MTATNAAPLIALDAVVIDTETTGLDPARARVVELGAVHLDGGRIAARTYRSLIAPGEPIPPAATAIHGIDESEIAGAPPFPGALTEFRDFIGERVVIGHSLGFDIAVLRNECARIGETFSPPRTLDTRLLAQVVSPNLADFSIEGLCSWLGVKLDGRHSALGDALATARIFCALVPKLREGNIRTLGEAATACRALVDALDAQHRAGWVTSGIESIAADTERTLSRIDSYPYRHRVRDVMSAPPLFIDVDSTLSDALREMMQQRVSSLYVRIEDESPESAEAAGIVTERDILRVLDQKGPPALGTPVHEIMSRPLETVPADAFVYRAIGRMTRLKYRHLGVVDERGRIVGALSARNLLRLRAGEAISLGDEIDQAEDVHALASAWAKLPEVARALLSEGVSGRDIAAVISRELGALTRQAAKLSETRMTKAGRGEAPCAYSIAVLGSAGRGESLLAMDQDNALIFAEGAPDGPQDRWFAEFAVHVADILHEVGVPYCKGGVMAKNPQWRASAETWRTRINQWVLRSQPDNLLSIDIFFDLRGVHGSGHLSDALWRDAFHAATGQIGFIKALAQTAGEFETGIGWFGRLRSEKGRIDLKRYGLFPIVTAARLLAIRHHVVERSTPARLAGLRALDVGGDRDLDSLDAAHAVFVDLVLAQQLEDISRGRSPGNAVMLKRLNTRDHARLRTALDAVSTLNELAHDLLFGGS